MISFTRLFTRPAVTSVFLTLTAAGILAMPAAQAAGSVEAGQTKAMVCMGCHGPGGNSFNPEWPRLAGQHATYTVRALRAFKTGERTNPLMLAQAMALSDQDMEDLGAYFASTQPQPQAADPGLAAKGERLYRGGNKEAGTSACIACHGPNGAGNGLAGYPSVAGQHSTYAANQLRAYRAGQRNSDANQMMRNTTARLTDAEIDALASYMQGLR